MILKGDVEDFGCRLTSRSPRGSMRLVQYVVGIHDRFLEFKYLAYESLAESVPVSTTGS